MCISKRWHKEGLKIDGIESLKGPVHKKRRKLKRKHTEQDGKCFWCGNVVHLWWEVDVDLFSKLEPNQIATIEHMVVASKGGGMSIDNITCACYECNSLRMDINASAFTYVTQDEERYAKFKRLKAEKRRRNAEAKVIRDKKREEKRISQLAYLLYWCIQFKGLHINKLEN